VTPGSGGDPGSAPGAIVRADRSGAAATNAPAVELWVVPGCAHRASASKLLREAMDEAGLAGVRFTTRLIRSSDQARQCAFAGSPSFLVNGTDLFDTPGQAYGLGCRLYRCGDALTGVPSRADVYRELVRALRISPS